MSGFHIPKWLDVILTAGDKLHKAVHPSRWGAEAVNDNGADE